MPTLSISSNHYRAAPALAHPISLRHDAQNTSNLREAFKAARTEIITLANRFDTQRSDNPSWRDNVHLTYSRRSRNVQRRSLGITIKSTKDSSDKKSQYVNRIKRTPSHIEGVEVLASGFHEISQQPGYESILNTVFLQVRTKINHGIDITIKAPQQLCGLVFRFFGPLPVALADAISEDFQTKLFRLFDLVSEEKRNNGQHIHLARFPNDTAVAAMSYRGNMFFNSNFDVQTYQQVTMAHELLHALRTNKLKDFFPPWYAEPREAARLHRHLFMNIGRGFNRTWYKSENFRSELKLLMRDADPSMEAANAWYATHLVSRINLHLEDAEVISQMLFNLVDRGLRSGIITN